MILTILIFLIAFLGFIARENKNLNFIFLALLLLAVYQDTGNADYLSYVNEYQDANFEQHVSDPFFFLLVKFFSKLGTPFELFRIIFFGVYFFILNKLISSKTRYGIWVWSLFATSVFCLHVVWMRYTMAFMFIYLGLYLYYVQKKTLFSYISFFVAVFFHFGVVICWPLLFIGEMSKRKYMIFIVVFLAGFFLLSNSNIINFLEMFAGDERTSYIERNYLSQDIARSGVYKIIESILTIIGVYLVLYLEKKKMVRLGDKPKQRVCISEIELLKRFNIYSITLIPFINVAEPIARYFLYIYPVYLIVFSYYYRFDKMKMFTGYDILIIFLTIGQFISFVGVSGTGYEYGFRTLFP